jgi:ubiquinone/menaquinone biosynthesis C-methylase UbiE
MKVVSVRARAAFTQDMDDPYDWDERVEAWEEVAATDAFRSLRDEVCARASSRTDDRVVDLGAGTGLIALALAPSVAEVVAVDISEQMLAQLDAHAAADGIDNVRGVVADLRELPLEDESVTLAVSNYAFHHLERPGKELALSEVRRVLVPGGRLVICDMMFALSLEPRDRALLWEKLVAIARRGPAGLLRIARNAGRMAVGRWEHPSAPQEWEEMLRGRGFDDIRIELLHHEAGIATASRPLVARNARGDGRTALTRSR